MKDTVLARYHAQSDEMVELYSIRKIGGADQFVLWASSTSICWTALVLITLTTSLILN